jgi:hypothetical protein
MEDSVGGQTAQPTIIFGFLLARLRRRPTVFTLSLNTGNERFRAFLHTHHLTVTSVRFGTAKLKMETWSEVT